MACSHETAFITMPVSKPSEVVTPYRHPKFIQDTTWIENAHLGMEMYLVDGNKPWSYTFVTDTNDAVRKGWQSQKFEVRYGDCWESDCNRTPVWERREFGESFGTVEGDDYWYGWSFYVPKNNGNSLYWTYISQFQQTPNHNPIWMFLKREGKGLCLLLEPQKHLNYDCYKDTSFELIPEHLFMGQWHDIVVHAVWKKDETGVFQVWVNGDLKVDYHGYTMTQPNTGISYKYGVYRQRESAATTVYFDEIRKGTSREQVDILLLEK